MIPALSLLVILGLSLLITRVATVALVHTGLSREAARFQARSAFTGVGFTTGESEGVVGHPVRRRVVMMLMLVGNVGIVTAMSTLLLSLLDIETGGATALGVIALGLGVLWWTASSQWVDARMSRVISWALTRWTSVDARDFARLLHLREDYGVTELRVNDGDWVAGKNLGATGIRQEGLMVLGVECPGGHFIGAPGPETAIRPGDLLLLYGRTPRIAELDQRGGGLAGDQQHREAMNEQADLSQKEHVDAGR